MARLLVLLVCLAASYAAEAMDANERAKAWLKDHQAPPDASELDILKQADPHTFNAVRALLNRQALGTLDQHTARGPARLSAAAMEQFKLSKATEDRKNVLSLEAKMFAEKQKWAQMEQSKSTKLSKALTDDKPKPKPEPVKTAFRKPKEDESRREEAEKELEAMPAPRKRLSNLAEGAKMSWGDLKKFAHAAKKSGGKKYVAPAPTGPSLGWGAILKNMAVRKQEELTGKNSALAGFSWGDDTQEAEEGEHKELSTLSKSQVRIPAAVDVPDQLADFIASGKKKQDAPQADATQQDAANPYSMDLN